MKLSKRAGRAGWVVDLGKVDGKRQRRYFTKKIEAQRFYDAIRAEREKFGVSALSITMAERQIVMIAREKLPKDVSMLDVIDYYIRHNPRSNILLSEAIKELISDRVEKGLREQSLRQYKHIYRWLLAQLGDLALADISEDMCRGALRAYGASAYARNNMLRALKMLFIYANKRDWLRTNPAGRFETYKTEDKPVDVLTVDQARELMNGAKRVNNGMISYFAIGAFTGIRPKEILRLAAESIDLESGFISVEGRVAKCRKRRVVEMSDNCRAWLSIYKFGRPAVHFQPRFQEVIRSTSIAWKQDIMRHSFASYFYALNGPDRTAQELGHASTDMLFKHYRELVRKDDARAYFEIYP